MHLVSFLSLALPWFKKQFFNNPRHKNFLSKMTELAHDLSGVKSDNAYQTVLDDAAKLLAFQKHAFAMQKQYIISACEDRKDARNRDLEHLRINGKNKRADLMIYLATFTLIGCLGILWFCRHILSIELVSVISATIGVFGSCLKDAYAFEFGIRQVEMKNDLAAYEHIKMGSDCTVDRYNKSLNEKGANEKIYGNFRKNKSPISS